MLVMIKTRMKSETRWAVGEVNAKRIVHMALPGGGQVHYSAPAHQGTCRPFLTKTHSDVSPALFIIYAQIVEDKGSVLLGPPNSNPGAGFTSSFVAQGIVVDLAPEVIEKRIVHMTLPGGVQDHFLASAHRGDCRLHLTFPEQSRTEIRRSSMRIVHTALPGGCRTTSRHQLEGIAASFKLGT